MNRVIQHFSARTLPLSITYRCAQRIVSCANNYVPQLQAAPGAPDGSVRAISIDDVERYVQPGDFILSRNNVALAKMAVQLQMAGLPFRQLGSKLAGELCDLIRKSKTHTTDNMRLWLDRYLEVKLAAFDDDDVAVHALDGLIDRIDTIKAIALGYNLVREVIDEIKAIYANNSNKDAVILSTVHKAKGKEASRVFILWHTFLQRPGTEETNIAYVAITRAKQELFFVLDPKAKRTAPIPHADR